MEKIIIKDTANQKRQACFLLWMIILAGLLIPAFMAGCVNQAGLEGPSQTTESSETVDAAAVPNTVPQGELPGIDLSKLEKAEVKRVVDGDTFVIDSGERVRLIGIDTPETVKPNSKAEYFGKEASDFSKKMLNQQTVYLEKDISDTDKYGRLLRYVYLADKTFINLLLVREGYANAVTYPPDVKYAKLFRQAEKTAKVNNKGLWRINAEK